MLTPSPLPRTLGAAVRDATHRRLEVRVSAVRDLGRLAKGEDRARALETLARVLADDESIAVRCEVLLALADARARECVDAVVDAAEHSVPRIRQMGLVALGELATVEDRRACQVIEAALAAEEPALRFQALVALHHVARDRAMPSVLGALEDEDDHVRYVALRIAEEQWLKESSAPVPPEALDAAKHALADESARVRLAAAILLARAGDMSGSDVIVRAVDAGVGAAEPEDAQAAIELAGELGLSGARRGLERRAWGLFGVSRDPFAWQAKVALARLGDERARAGILKGLRAWTRDTRTLAVAAAGHARLGEARALIEAMRGDQDRADPDAVAEALALIDGA
jgi:HEAT repeat protein